MQTITQVISYEVQASCNQQQQKGKMNSQLSAETGILYRFDLIVNLAWA